MEEVFQNFKHYSEWILNNWERDKVLDSVIVKNKLMIERENNCNGESYRLLTKEEFSKRDSENFIKIPTIYESDDYQDGHSLADEEINDFDNW